MRKRRRGGRGGGGGRFFSVISSFIYSFIVVKFGSDKIPLCAHFIDFIIDLFNPFSPSLFLRPQLKKCTPSKKKKRINLYNHKMCFNNSGVIIKLVRCKLVCKFQYTC